MASKPETTFIQSIHRHFPKPATLYHEKMNNPYNSGTADVWYSGRRGDIWVEYKFLRDGKIPVRAPIDLVTKQRYLSALQLDWLEGRSTEGRNVWVIVGCKEGGVVWPRNKWREPMGADVFRSWVHSRKDLADLIRGACEP